eukprot:5728727-Amphidinium_carterae.1
MDDCTKYPLVSGPPPEDLPSGVRLGPIRQNLSLCLWRLTTGGYPRRAVPPAWGRGGRLQRGREPQVLYRMCLLPGRAPIERWVEPLG